MRAPGSERQLGVVVEAELAAAVVADLDHLVLAHDVADGELALLLVEVGLDDADDGARVADLGARFRGGRKRRQEGQPGGKGAGSGAESGQRCGPRQSP